ncbi:hypothetical protein HN011_011093 [Eciton burchellii]|nr:hypothetical protein HN011_011093 [Eciton burchellii]
MTNFRISERCKFMRTNLRTNDSNTDPSLRGDRVNRSLESLSGRCKCSQRQHPNRSQDGNLQDSNLVTERSRDYSSGRELGKGVPLLKVNNNSENRRIGAPIEAWTNARIMSGDRNSEPAVN